MGCYFTLCHNTYGYSLLFYKVYTKRENVGSWNSGLEKEQILEAYSTQLQKSWKLTEYLKINKEKSSPKMKARGPHPAHEGGGRASYLVGLLVALRRPSSPIWGLSMRKKIRDELFGTKLRFHEAEPWRNQSRALAELFCRGHFLPGGGNHHQHHHQWSSHREGVNLHQHLHQHHLLSKP